MSEKHAGWWPAESGAAFSAPVTINGQAVYYHAGRDQCAIERDHLYLAGLTEAEQAILDGILENQLHRDEPDYREGYSEVSRVVRLGWERW